MVEPQTAVFVLALFFLRYSSCTEKCLRFRRLSLTPSRFAEKFTAIGGISLSECAERGTNEDVLGINYQANTRECELIKRAGGCIEYENGNITGWQAYRSCDIETAGSDHKSVTQSSENSHYRPATLAFDDDYDTISVTAAQPQVDRPWWILEFCYEVTITGLRIWNRKDCCADQLSNLNITVNDQFCGHINDAPGLGAMKEVMCPEPLTGTFVKIQKMETKELNLAEVEPIFTDDGC